MKAAAAPNANGVRWFLSLSMVTEGQEQYCLLREAARVGSSGPIVLHRHPQYRVLFCSQMEASSPKIRAQRDSSS